MIARQLVELQRDRDHDNGQTGIHQNETKTADVKVAQHGSVQIETSGKKSKTYKKTSVR